MSGYVDTSHHAVPAIALIPRLSMTSTATMIFPRFLTGRNSTKVENMMVEARCGNGYTDDSTESYQSVEGF